MELPETTVARAMRNGANHAVPLARFAHIGSVTMKKIMSYGRLFVITATVPSPQEWLTN